MTTLLIADHDNQSLKEPTARALTAAAELGSDVQVLVAGTGCAGAAEATARRQALPFPGEGSGQDRIHREHTGREGEQQPEEEDGPRDTKRAGVDAQHD